MYYIGIIYVGIIVPYSPLRTNKEGFPETSQIPKKPRTPKTMGSKASTMGIRGLGFTV